MSYYLFNRQELLPKAKERHHNCDDKEKAAKYYLQNRGVWKEKAKISIKTWHKKKKN